MCKTSPHSSKSLLERSRHVDSNYCDDVSWRALSCVLSLSQDLQCSGNMTNGNLVRRLLDLDFLVTHELGGLDLHNKLTFSLVSNTLLTWAFYFRVELSCVNNLINFISTHIASVYCYSDTRLDITSLSDNTFHLDESSNLL